MAVRLSLTGDVDAAAATVGSGDSDGATAAAAADTGRRGAVAGDLAGQQLAHYRVEKRLGRGGMGEVYLATDLALDRPVALKIISPGLASDPGLRQRFLREARAQARLQHPNVCHIYYVGEQDGRLFFAMEYVDGESLQEKLERAGSLPAGEVVELCRQAALGLREAHRHGFTHRDVKPSNLMVDRHGTVKLVDFGLVKHAGVAGDPGASATDAHLSKEGASFVGTPLYVAPEQARGDRVDFRADMYSLGATMHHLIMGRPPFSGDSALAIISRHLVDRRPRLEAARPRWGPSPLDGLCDRLMAKRPADRFASYDDLLAAMERVSPATSRPAGVWVRGFAAVLDMAILTILLVPLKAVVGDGFDLVAFGLLGLAYHVVANGRFGRTLGKAALDLEVVPTERAGAPGYGLALKRWTLQFGLATMDLVILNVLDRVKDRLPELVQLLVAVPAVIFALIVPVGGAIMMLLRPDRRSPWDVLSGTQVRYTRGAAAATSRRP